MTNTDTFYGEPFILHNGEQSYTMHGIMTNQTTSFIGYPAPKPALNKLPKL